MDIQVEPYDYYYLMRVDGVYQGGKYLDEAAALAAAELTTDDMEDLWVQHYSTVGNSPLSSEDVARYIANRYTSM